jgi:hypothetical protein
VLCRKVQRQTAPTTSRERPALVAPALATYIPAMLTGFVWDDRKIIDNRLIKAPNRFHWIFLELSAMSKIGGQ